MGRLGRLCYFSKVSLNTYFCLSLGGMVLIYLLGGEMRKIGRIIDVASYIGGYLAGWVLLGIMSLTMIEVVSRYVLHRPLIFADEFGAYSLVAIVLLGLAYCWRERGHIRINFVISRMPARVSNWIRVVTLTAALVYVGVASKVSYDFVVYSFRRGIKSNSWLMTPLMWPQMVIPIGFTILFLVLIVEIARAVRNIRAGVSIEAISEEKAEGGAV